MHECFPFLDEVDELQVDRILKARQEETEAGAKFTQSSLFKMGWACGSFSVGQIDQGIHILLPTWDKDGEYYAEFSPLFKDYFDKLTGIPAAEAVGSLYIGAVQTFCRDQDIDIGSDHFIEAFEAATA